MNLACTSLWSEYLAACRWLERRATRLQSVMGEVIADNQQEVHL